MIDKKSEHLINERLDGALPAEAEPQLEDILHRSQEARSYFEDLKRIQAAIDQAAREEDVPLEIKAVVLQTISEMQPGWQTSETLSRRPGWLHTFMLGFRRKPALAGGLIFATGFGLGFATLSTMHPGASGDSRALPGFMAPAMRQSSLLARESISLPGLNGFIESRLAKQDVIVHIDLRSDARVEVTMAYEGGLLRPKGFQLAEPALGGVALGPNELRFSHQGANSYVFVLRKPDQKSDLRILFQSGGETLEKRLPTSER